MVQEVQTQGNWYQTPNRIEGIGVSERKVSDHTQVRNHWTNGCKATDQHNGIVDITENFTDSWIVTEDDTVKYRAVGSKLYIPLAGTYLIEFQMDSPYNVSNSVKFKIYNGKKAIYTLNTVVNDKTKYQILLNLGRKNEITTGYYVSGIGYNVYNIPIYFNIVKL